MSRLTIIGIAGIGLGFFACKKDYDKITTVRVKPPVQESLPTALISGGSFSLQDYTKTCQTHPSQGDVCGTLSAGDQIQCIIKNRLFCKGPTEVLTLLDNLDGRLAEIENRSGEGEVPCIKNAAVDATSDLTFPGGVTFPHKLQCRDSSIGLGFGSDGGTWYVREAGGAAGSVFSVSPENVVDGYLYLPTSDGTFNYSTGLLRIHANRANSTVEITGGGVGLGFCSFHFHSNASNIYVYANPDGVGSSCDYDSSGAADGDDWVEVCLDATTMDSVDVSTCDTLKNGLTLTTLARDTSSATGGNVSSWDAAAQPGDRTVNSFEMKDYLQELFNNTKTLDHIPEFKTEDDGGPI